MGKYNKDYYKKHKRLRDKRYIDYGIKKGEEKTILEYAQQCDYSEKVKILIICADVKIEIFDTLYESVCKGLSYERLDRKYAIPYTKSDFYAYRRKVIAEIRKEIINAKTK